MILQFGPLNAGSDSNCPHQCSTNNSDQRGSRYQDFSSSLDKVPSILPVGKETCLPTSCYCSFREIVRKMPHTNEARVDTHNAMTNYGSNICTEHATLQFKQPCSTPSIQPWPDHACHSTFIRSCPPAVVLKGTPILTNSPVSSMIVPHLASSSPLQFPEISLYPEIQTICTLNLFASLVKSFRQP